MELFYILYTILKQLIFLVFDGWFGFFLEVPGTTIKALNLYFAYDVFEFELISNGMDTADPTKH